MRRPWRTGVPHRPGRDAPVVRGARAPAGGAPSAARLAAAVAASAVVAGALSVIAAVVAGPGPAAAGYISEAGAPDFPMAAGYRLGMLLLAAGTLLTGGALAPLVRSAGALLAAAAGFLGLSAAVPCTPGCPLPPYEPTTLPDLVHAGSAIVAAAAGVFAMVALAVAGTAPPLLRRLSGVAAGLSLPLGAGVGLAMLFVGRGPVIGLLERVLFVVAAAWLVAIATLRAADLGWRLPLTPMPATERGADR